MVAVVGEAGGEERPGQQTFPGVGHHQPGRPHLGRSWVQIIILNCHHSTVSSSSSTVVLSFWFVRFNCVSHAL